MGELYGNNLSHSLGSFFLVTYTALRGDTEDTPLRVNLTYISLNLSQSLDLLLAWLCSLRWWLGLLFD